MKKNFTKLSAIILLGLLCVCNLDAQTNVYSGSFPITMTGYAEEYTTPVNAGWAASTSVPSSSARNGKCFPTATDANFNSGKNLTYWLPSCGTMTLQANGTVGRGFIITVVKVSDGSQLSRTVWAYSNATCSSTDITVNSSEAVKITILSPNSAEAPITGTGSSYISYINITGYAPATPTITAFTVVGVDATIDQTAKTITAVLPYGTVLSSLTPTVTTGGTATGYTPAGAQDFSAGAVTYTATGTPDVNYVVTLTASSTASSDKDISDLKVGAYTPAFNSGTNTYSLVLPKASVTSQPVTFSIPATATANFTSGTSHDFSSPLTVTVTAQDLSTKHYTVSATVASKNIAYILNTALSVNDTKIRPELAKTYYLENILIANVTTATDFSNYDLVIMTESPSSGSAGMKALWGINKPLLALKMYAVGSNTWNISTAANPSPAATTATISEPNHPVFAGITGTGAYGVDVAVLSTITSGNGLQVAPYTSNYALAGITGSTSSSIIELPVGTASSMTSGYTNVNLQQKFLIIGISDNNQQNTTADGLKLITNAVNYLTGATSWGTDAGTLYKDTQVSGATASSVEKTTATITWNALPGTTGYSITSASGPFAVKGNGVKSEVNLAVDGASTTYNLTGLNEDTEYTFSITGQNALGVSSVAGTVLFKTKSIITGTSSAIIEAVTYDGKNILNPKGLNLSVFDISGRFILKSNQDINMSDKAKGIYVVKSGNGVMKISVK
ncbi:MAG: fibronectin type III domain-containing protein [Paludibacteraceae bacterium]